MPKLNFSHPNLTLTKMGFDDHQLHVDLADADLMEKIRNYLLPLVGNGSEPVTIVPPGLAPLVTLVIVAIHGLTGSFPFVVFIKRDELGTFNPLPATDLQGYRNSCVRISRKGLQTL
jgi:hypothetical protein